MNCEICKRVKERKRVIFYEDENVIACLAAKQVTLGKTSVYYKKHVTKFTDLSEEERNSLMNSVIKVAAMIEKALKPDHMNYSLLGNYHKHLHWHVIPRYEDKTKDNFYFNNGLEYPILGRRVYGHYDASREELEKVKSIIIGQETI